MGVALPAAKVEKCKGNEEAADGASRELSVYDELGGITPSPPSPIKG